MLYWNGVRRITAKYKKAVSGEPLIVLTLYRRDGSKEPLVLGIQQATKLGSAIARRLAAYVALSKHRTQKRPWA
jgi:hypothetical protein